MFLQVHTFWDKGSDFYFMKNLINILNQLRLIDYTYI